MKRLFNDHEIRKVISLSGAWSFCLDPEKIGERDGWQNGLTNAETVIVPSVWNNELGHLNYEGWGWYEKKFKTDGGTLLFEFESVMTMATVWLDGKEIGAHYGAFTQFEFICQLYVQNNIGCTKIYAMVSRRTSGQTHSP
jgi:beta-glucuronidase